MNQENEKKNDYPWDSLDTTTLMLPLEIITYHIYKHEVAKKNRRVSDEAKELQIMKSYMQKEKKKEVEVGKCFQR